MWLLNAIVDGACACADPLVASLDDPATTLDTQDYQKDFLGQWMRQTPGGQWEKCAHFAACGYCLQVQVAGHEGCHEVVLSWQAAQVLFDLQHLEATQGFPLQDLRLLHGQSRCWPHCARPQAAAAMIDC